MDAREPKHHNLEAHAVAHAKAECSAEVVRGEKSWSKIWMAWTAVVALEGTIIAMTDAPAANKIVGFVIAFGVTSYFMLNNGWVHNKLIGWISGLEGKGR